MKLIQIHPSDNVAVALETIAQGEALETGSLTAREEIQRGHKVALREIAAGSDVVKYGCVIGRAREDIPAGAWVHVHNTRTGLSEDAAYTYNHKILPLPETAPRTFRGFRRADGRAAITNELWVLPNV